MPTQWEGGAGRIAGKIACPWKHPWPGLGWIEGVFPGAPTTAGGVLFTGDPSGDFIAFDAITGKIPRQAPTGGISNTPRTYMPDGHQYVPIGAGGALYASYSR